MKNLFTAGLLFLAQLAIAQGNQWSAKPDLTGAERYIATSFTIGTDIYVGTGLKGDNSTALADMWQYNTTTDQWISRNNFEGSARIGAVGFSINGKGYLGLGGDLSGSSFLDFWQYDPLSDDWTKLADFPGQPRAGAYVFVVGNKAYVGGGQTTSNALLNDLWEYNSLSNTWTSRSGLPATARMYATAFAIGTKGYVGVGLDASDNTLGDFWEYNTSTNQWTQKANYPTPVSAGVGFATATRGYIGMGQDNKMWSYYPNENAWIAEADFATSILVNGVCAFANGKAYAGIGLNAGSTNIFYQYVPALDQSITFAALPTKIFGDAMFSPGATSSSGLTVSYTSSNEDVATVNGSQLTITGAGASTITAIQEGNGTTDAAASVQRTLTVNKANQTITFNALPGKKSNDLPFDLTATTTSPLTVTYTSSNTNVATISGVTVTIVGAGTTTVKARQPGNANYNAAVDVQRDLVVTKVDQAITFGALADKSFSDEAFDLAATTNSSLPISYASSNTAVATISGSTVTMKGVGTTTITASQAGNAVYSAAVSVQQPFKVTKGSQSWVGSLPVAGNYGNNITLNVHLSSGLKYNLTSSNQNVATVAFNGTNWIITPTGIGTTTLTASNSGDTNFNSLTSLTANLQVSKGTQTITFADIPVKHYGDLTFPLVATASSGLPVTFESGTIYGEIQVTGNLVYINSSYSGMVTAKQPGNEFYLPAPDGVKPITVLPLDLAMAIESIPEKSVNDAPFRPTIKPDFLSDLSSSNHLVAVIDGDLVSIVGPGTTTIFATRNDGVRWTTKVVSTQLTVKEFHEINFLPIDPKTIGDEPFVVEATASSGLPVTFSSGDPSIATVSGSTVTIHGVGSTFISAIAGDATYASAKSSRLLVVKSLDQSPTTQGELWGIQTYGGSNGAGVVFKTNPDGTQRSIVKEFDGGVDAGTLPAGGLLKAPNGKVYGITRTGGANNGGVIFEFNPATNIIKKVHDFELTDYPSPSLAMTSNGKIYGSRTLGTTANGPTVYEFDTSTGVFSDVASLFGVMSTPTDVLVSGTGKIYVSGPDANTATRLFYEVDPGSGTVTKKAAMTQGYSYNPAGMVEGDGGKFYGTTQTNSTQNEGFVFEFDPAAGTCVPKVNFDITETGSVFPQGLMRASSGKFYGISSRGGDASGYLYEFNPALNSVTTRAIMPTYGGGGAGFLTEGTNGKLYGTGTGAGGNIFEFAPTTNNLVTLMTFPRVIGNYTFGTLMLSGGKLYGLQREGGTHNSGVLFEFDYNTTTFTPKAEFASSFDGYYPIGAVVQASDGMMYGVTQAGGVNNQGIIFQVDPATNVYTNVYDFSANDVGYTPADRLTVGLDGKLYGATISGGVYYDGSIYEFDPETKGVRALVYLTSSKNGMSVLGGVVQAPSGKLYASTMRGGVSYNGTLLEIDPASKATRTVVTFGDDGIHPLGTLMISSDGRVFGTTTEGGDNNVGVLFEYEPFTGQYAVRHHFESATGARPAGALVEVNGKLYGTTNMGGTHAGGFGGGLGVIYEYNPGNKVYTMKFDFATAAHPGGDLLIGANGKLYGNTTFGKSASEGGVIFEYDVTSNTVVEKQTLPFQLYSAGYITTSITQTRSAYRQEQVLTIDPIDPKVVGQAAFTPTASSTSGLVVSFSASDDKLSVTNNEVSPLKAGKATIKANQAGDPSFRSAAEASAIFCVNPAKPVINYTNANTNLITLSSSNPSGNQWFKDGNIMNDATAAQLGVTQPGIYTVQSTVEECEGEMSDPFPVIVTGDIDANRETFALYPNPVVDRLYIALPGGNRKTVTLVPMDGRVVEEHQTSENLLEIDVRGYSAGLYIVRIADENGERPALKFIKK